MSRYIVFALCILALASPAFANAADDLAEALLNGDVAAVKAAVDKSPALLKITTTGSTNKGDTLLNRAAYRGELDLAKYLLAKGSDVNHPGYGGAPPLEQAASQGHPDVVKLLISKGAGINSRPGVRTPLHAAIFASDAECVKLLLAAGADLEAKDSLGNTPLRGASERGRSDLVKILLAKGANPNAKGFMNKTILQATTDAACLALLKKAGAK